MTAHHIHLDPLGGVAGDMFLAAILDAWPEHFDGLLRAVRQAGLPATITMAVEDRGDHALAGKRLRIEGPPDAKPTGAYAAIVERLRGADLEPAVLDRALGIFALLAEAEASVHGVPVDSVSFHELAGWDSVADIVGAAYLIEALSPASWSVGPLPLGRGRVETAHGPLPVPAPATARLLEGFAMVDDGVEGERVTPTGAAILRHLGATSAMPAEGLVLRRSGYGFGTRKLPGISNALRVLVFDTLPVSATEGDEVGVIAFEVDDQTPEELAVGLDVLRATEGVLDVLQMPAFGKKGRIVIAIQILCEPAGLDHVMDACFAETTTIGLRWNLTRRRVLRRQSVIRDDVPVKMVERPGGGRTAKAEMDSLRERPGGAADRSRYRRQLEEDSLKGQDGD